MAKAKNLTNLLACDFSGSDEEPKVVLWRNAQKRLSSLSNPYTGNKRKIVVDIASSLEKEGIQYETVLDLFGGSSVVSIFMKLIGKNVITNELLTSSYYNAVAFVENSDDVVTPEDLKWLKSFNNPGRSDFNASRWSERFTNDESQFLDNFRANIYAKHATIEDARKAKSWLATAFVMIEHYIINRCFIGGRLNNGQIIANLKHRLDHARNDGMKNNGVEQLNFNIKKVPTFEGSKSYYAYNCDAVELLKKPLPHKVDLIYIDPPYGGSQSDYAKMFSWCEEYIYQKPLEEIPHISSSKKFVSVKEYEFHFRELLSHCSQFPCWAISYNDSSWADVEKITQLIKEFRSNVKVVDIDHEYKYRKERSDATEYLFIAY